MLKVEKPASYIGNESYQIIKEDGSFKSRFAFCFPDTYEIGMSWNGLPILYNLVNKTDHTYMERVFAPRKDMEEQMRNAGLPLYTMETKTPVNQADIVGFTLQYEMSYTNILNMLDLAGIPLRSKDRSESDPLVVAGGPCAFNAEPLADFFDAIMVGDGEEQLPELCKVISECKENGLDKHDTLLELSKIQGVYIPAFYKPIYDSEGNYTGIEKTEPGAPDKVVRAFLADLDSVEYPQKNIVPLVDVVHDRAVCELFRGCTRGCRFCQAGMIYRPIRERSLEKNYEAAINQLKNSGHRELSLLSLSSSDYSQFQPLILKLIEYCKPKQIGISLPSLRLDNFAFKIMDEIQGMRKSGLTFAPEAGTQRLRDIINKNINEEHILGAIEKAIDLGWNNVKLYFMIGLPGETDEDLDGIAALAEKIMNIAKDKNGGSRGRFSVSASVANFVPKPFTPFQWEPQNTPEEFARKHNYLMNKIRPLKGVTLHYHESYVSTLEAILARGGRELSNLIERAWQLGASFDAWTETFKEGVWKQALKENGIDENCKPLKGYGIDDALPWDIIDCGVSKNYFKNELKKAHNQETTKDCRYGCTGCGVNRYTNCPADGMLSDA